jgi:hypothetical protein
MLGVLAQQSADPGLIHEALLQLLVVLWAHVRGRRAQQLDGHQLVIELGIHRLEHIAVATLADVAGQPVAVANQLSNQALVHGGGWPAGEFAYDLILFSLWA